MNDDELSELKAREEAKRERCWDPRERWLALQATITWAEAQLTVRRNVRAARLAEQAEKLAQLGWSPEHPDGQQSPQPPATS